MTPAAPVLESLIQLMPYTAPFLFVDRITYVDEERIEGDYYLHPGHDFYKGHFPGQPVTPGVILIEVMAQIGLVALGLHLLAQTGTPDPLGGTHLPVMASADVKFYKKVLPGERVFVQSEKILFRHGKLVCRVRLLDSNDCLMAAGDISGFLAPAS